MPHSSLDHPPEPLTRKALDSFLAIATSPSDFVRACCEDLVEAVWLNLHSLFSHQELKSGGVGNTIDRWYGWGYAGSYVSRLEISRVNARVRAILTGGLYQAIETSRLGGRCEPNQKASEALRAAMWDDTMGQDVPAVFAQHIAAEMAKKVDKEIWDALTMNTPKPDDAGKSGLSAKMLRDVKLRSVSFMKMLKV